MGLRQADQQTEVQQLRGCNGLLYYRLLTGVPARKASFVESSLLYSVVFFLRNMANLAAQISIPRTPKNQPWKRAEENKPCNSRFILGKDLSSAHLPPNLSLW